jgi:hypothetical protein
MNTAVTRAFRILDVVIPIKLILMLVIEPCSQELHTESMEIGQRSEYQSATCYIIHACELHVRVAIQLVKDRPFALVTLCDCGFGFASTLTEKSLEGVQNILMCRAPLFNDE